VAGGTIHVIHVIGAGMAGLSAATQLAERGHRVRLYESTRNAGGRCRSFHDDQLGCVIDNGNHLILAGNTSTQGYIERIGARDRLLTAERAAFQFMDLKTDERWTLDLGRGGGSWRLLTQMRGLPGVTRLDLLSVLRFRRASSSATVLEQMARAGTIYHRLWEPLCMAVLNTEPDCAMAAAMWPVVKETFGLAPDACRPVMAKVGLSHALVDPALEYLQQAGVKIEFNATLKDLETDASRITRLRFSDETMAREIMPGDKVILAVPIGGINAVMPAIETPDEFRPIVNAHFLLPSKSDELTIIGLINGKSHWIFRKGNVASVTVSAATSLVGAPSEKIADLLWRDVCGALQMNGVPLGPHRIIKEKRATFAQTPDQNRRRPGAKTGFSNLFLAGDWTATGLPATIEGAVRSGEISAKLCEE